jgi:hypoxanthine phosphoribosyltransferase
MEESTKSVQTNEFYDRIKNNKKYLLVDEIYDTGKTFLAIKERLKNIEYDFSCLISRYNIHDNGIIIGRVLNNTNWIVFPWENRNIK